MKHLGLSAVSLSNYEEYEKSGSHWFQSFCDIASIFSGILFLAFLLISIQFFEQMLPLFFPDLFSDFVGI